MTARGLLRRASATARVRSRSIKLPNEPIERLHLRVWPTGALAVMTGPVCASASRLIKTLLPIPRSPVMARRPRRGSFVHRSMMVEALRMGSSRLTSASADCPMALRTARASGVRAARVSSCSCRRAMSAPSHANPARDSIRPWSSDSASRMRININAAEALTADSAGWAARFMTHAATGPSVPPIATC